MSFVLPRAILLQALKLKPVSSSKALVRFPSRTLKFSSASCQPSVEVGDNSAGEVPEEVPAQQIATLQEQKRGELVRRAEIHESVPLPVNLEPEQEAHGRFPSKTLKFSSASCQQSVEVRDNSAGEVPEEVPAQQIATLQEQKREELVVKRAEIHESVLLRASLEPEQEAHVRWFPLRVVVENCAKRWFKEQLKAAEKGDSDAQVTVGQMICHGYGVPKDVHKGEEWLRRAANRRKSKQSKERQDQKRQENEEMFFM